MRLNTFSPKVIGLVALMIFSLSAIAQKLPGKTIFEDIAAYRKHVFQEKVYLHMDNAYYALGDTVWFKGYVVAAETNIPSERSKILHVDLVDMQGQVKEHIAVPVGLGLAAGELTIPDSLQQGNYIIRAYTNHMREFDRSAIFEQVIRIISALPSNNSTSISGIAKNPATIIQKANPHPERKQNYLMDVDADHPDTITVTLQAKRDYQNGEELTLLPLHNGIPLFVFKTQFPDTLIHLSIPRWKMPEGIIQFSLFNPAKEQIAERLVYNRIETAADIQMLNLKSSYFSRKPVELEIAVTDKFGKPVLGSFSVSVTNSSIVHVDDDKRATISSNLLLSSQLQTGIRNPNYYFSSPNAEKDRKLNQYLQTQTLRRPDWGKIVNPVRENNNEFRNEEFELKGKISSVTKTQSSGLRLTLLAGDLLNGVLLDTLTNPNGQFVFKVPDSLIFEPFRLDIKGKDYIDYKVVTEDLAAAEVDQGYLRFADIDSHPSLMEDAKFKATIAERNSNSANNKAIKLDEVKISSYRSIQKLPKNSRSLNLNGPGQADQVFTSEFLSKLLNISQLVPMLNGVNADLSLRSNYGVSHAPPMLIIVDGTPGSSLEGFSMTDLESVELLRNVEYTGIYGIRGSGGVLIVTTKKPGSGRVAATNQSRIIPALFSPAKHFYVPNYKTSSVSIQKDLRTTVFWDPNLITDANGRVKFSFVNSDLPGIHTITIEGVSTQGEVFSKVFRYEVVKSN